MKDDPFSEGLLLRYLLGDLTEEEQAQIEERAFEDHQYLRNLQAVESDLIDEYVRGGLSERERRRFEGRFLASAERRRKVEFARALATVTPDFVVTEKKTRRGIAMPPAARQRGFAALFRELSPAPRYALAAAALLIMLSGAWLVAESLRLRGQLVQLRAERESDERQQQTLQQQVMDELARRADLSAQLERERQQRERDEQLVSALQGEVESTTQPAPSTVLSLALRPGLARSGAGRPKLALPPSAQLVKLQIGIEPEDEYQSYRAELRGPGGQPIWTQGDLHGRQVRAGRNVTLNVPAKLLAAGQYELSLKGTAAGGTIDDIGYYYFEVLKK